MAYFTRFWPIKAALLLTLGGIAFSSAGYAANGGGTALLCFNRPGIASQVRKDERVSDAAIAALKSIEMYDLFEAKLKRGAGRLEFEPKLITMPKDANPQAFASQLVLESALKAPKFAELVLHSIKSLNEKNIRYQPFGVQFVKDARAIGLIDEENCVLATIAHYRVATSASGELLLTGADIDQRLFFHPFHSPYSRAVVWLDLWIYMAGMRVGQTDSRATRTMISLLLSEESGAIKVADMATQLRFIAKADGETYYSRARKRLDGALLVWARQYFLSRQAARDEFIGELLAQVPKDFPLHRFGKYATSYHFYLLESLSAGEVDRELGARLLQMSKEYLDREYELYIKHVNETVAELPEFIELFTLLKPSDRAGFIKELNALLSLPRFLTALDLMTGEYGVTLSHPNVIRVDTVDEQTWISALKEISEEWELHQ